MLCLLFDLAHAISVIRKRFSLEIFRFLSYFKHLMSVMIVELQTLLDSFSKNTFQKTFKAMTV